MKITSAQYYKNVAGEITTVLCEIDGTKSAVPTDPDNRHYAEILKQVKEGTLTIKDAD
jgi:hypothetical protein